MSGSGYGAPIRQTSQIAYPSKARTAADANVEFDGTGAKGCIVNISETAHAATPSTVFNLEGWDPAGNIWYTILASAAITTEGNTRMRVWPGATAAANTAANDWLPRKWRIRPVHGTADSQTYSVGVDLLY